MYRPSNLQTFLRRTCVTASILTLAACSGGGGGDDETIASAPSGQGDSTPPSVSILTPTSGPTYQSNTSTITLTGSASDNVALASLRWETDRGESGTIDVAQNWRSGTLTVQSGSTVITVIATDSANNEKRDTLTVQFSPSGPTTGSAAQSKISYQSDLGNSFLLDGATVERQLANLIVEPSADWQSRGVNRLVFYCCKRVDGLANEPHSAAVVDSAAPYALAVDLGQYEPSSQREFYYDVFFNDGSAPQSGIAIFQIRGSSSGGNSAPRISGSPSTQVVAGQTYSFTPSATDADGDLLTFSISGKPAWASFDSATGRLMGQPSNGDVGLYSNIRISVSDGELSDSLPAFSVSVGSSATGSASLSWTPPTTRTDGSPLNNLAGFRIYYGTSSGVYTETISLNSAGLTSYLVEGLSGGTWFFTMTSFDTDGIESNFSPERSKTIN